MEGTNRPDRLDFLDDDEKAEIALEAEDDNISAGDYEAELAEKMTLINNKHQPKMGMFEKNHYFDKLFPSLKIQKPGYDLYGTTTLFLGILAAYVFLYYGSMSVDQTNYLKNSSNVNSIFKGDMVICLLTVITIIVIERYVNRSDTKAVDQKGLVADKNNSFFSQEDMFARTSTARSMTVKLKTLKTADLDMQGGSAQEFLKTMYGDNEDGESNFDNTRTKITTQ